jgi:predicted ATPase/class 3 adenylate cyclase
MVARPTGTVSFLFTDIEGSTRLLHEAGEARYSDLLETHRSLLRSAFGATGGYEEGTEGDSFFVAFERANDAADAASAAQRGLAEHPWPAGLELRVRIGIHTGEPLVGPTGYVGVDVHKAARIMTAGHGGQVLLSEETRRLLAERFVLRDLGEHRLKDLLKPQRLYELAVEGLPRAFPPLRTLEGRPTNLPTPVSDFIGRGAEVGAIVRLVRDERRRLVTLTGVGGGGKTRLALRAAAELIDEFTDGVFHVPLSTLRDERLVLAQIARALEVAEEPDEPLADALPRAIGRKAILLLLDSFDRVRPAAPQVVRLLETCPGLAMLVTSRIPLSIGGETVHPVPPLQPSDALDLLVSRAQSYGVRLERADPALVTIAEQVDCLPLGLELAAARLRLLSPAELATKVEQAVFESGRLEHAPTRQQTIRSMIDWSYELMSPAEQQLFARLSVFGSAASLTALEVICGAGFETLEGLLNAGFLRRQEGSDGLARFVLPSPVRSYARERLRLSGEEPEVARAHATYYLGLARSSLEAGDAVSETNDEQQNYHAALVWAQAHDAELASTIRAALGELFRVRGQVEESRSVIAGPLVPPRREPQVDDDHELSAVREDLDAGRRLLSDGDPAQAVRHFARALQTARDEGSDPALAEAALYLGYAELAREAHSRALRALLVGLRVVESDPGSRWAGAYLEGFAAIATATGELLHAARMQGAAAACAGGAGPETAAEISGSTREAIVTALGTDAYDRAHARGRRLTLREAADEARTGTAPPL